MDRITGTDLSEEITGLPGDDLIVGRGGDDNIEGTAGKDVIFGDYAYNLLAETEGKMSFAGYADTSQWQVSELPGGHNEMSQVVTTTMGAEYQLTFEVAANLGAGVVQGGVEILWNGESLGHYEAESGLFEPIIVSFTGTGEAGALTFRSVEPQGTSEIDTSGPIFSYEKTVEIGGKEVSVAAFAEGQPNLYQVLNGTLVVFDPETQSYEQAGAKATVTVNAIGFNVEDDLIYGIAVKKGFDALGNAIAERDLVMIDADGLSYRMGETPYRSWTGDFDDKGNLWAFEADMDYFMRVDVSERDEDGNPVVERFNLPDELISARVWDMAYDAATQTFSGVVRPQKEGGEGTFITVDISGDAPEFSLVPVMGTVIDGVLHDGLPAVTFGAAIIDANGTLYVGGNSGDHDMDDSTGSSGGFYRVDTDPVTGETFLVLVADAPRASSNDGAADPRALDPFQALDLDSSILIRGIEMIEDPSGASSFDDTVDGNAGTDEILGNQGNDQLNGSSAGDTIDGGTGDDVINGGAAPGHARPDIISSYDDDGLRFDQHGTLLEEDDDVLLGGAGDDVMSGSAGHDRLDGGQGDDQLKGGSGSDSLDGGTGNDLLKGGSGADKLFGSDGEDSLNGGSGDDALSGGNGADSLRGQRGDDNLQGGEGDDKLQGGSGNDNLAGGEGADLLKGQSGDDALAGGAGEDVLRGDKGRDTLDGGAGNDTLNGGSNDDELSGGDGKDFLNGASGNDLLDGGAGNDRLYLGAGDDIARGGQGSDRFVFRKEDMDEGSDLILDFRNDATEADTIDLRALQVLEGTTADAWLKQYVTLQTDGSVTVDLGGCELGFANRGEDDGQAFYAEICDGFLF
ncbi:MAG: calcium-binding protein [Pseudomonadota bacterium]